VVPVWIKVRVPADATPGNYSGTLTISAKGAKPVTVPVKMHVAGWKLPDPRDYSSHLGMIQSPESVALRYKVPLWSEEHWKLMERSFKLMGEVGNKYLVLPLITRTHFGNSQTIVRWIRNPSAKGSGQGAKYKHDFSILDRYLDLALKYTRPDVVCLYVSDQHLGGGKGGGGRGWDRHASAAAPVQFTLLDPAGGKVSEATGPKYTDPEAEAFWAPVAAGVKARLAKRGLAKAMMLGITADGAIPKKEIPLLFKKLLPGAKWIENAHVTYSNIGGVPVGYSTNVYYTHLKLPGQSPEKFGAIGGRFYGWRRHRAGKHFLDLFPRGPGTLNPMTHSAGFSTHRFQMEAALMANYSGIGRIGADLWPVLKDKRGRKATITARYGASHLYNLTVKHGTEFLLESGRKGAIPSVRFEMFREGLQECEARIFIERQLLDEGAKRKLGGELAARARKVLDERSRKICYASWTKAPTWYSSSDWEGRAGKLFSLAGEVAEKLGLGSQAMKTAAKRSAESTLPTGRLMGTGRSR
jgi:hypothetical protein